MHVIEIMVSVATFGDVLGAMRDWLDRNKCGPVKFETATEAPGSVRVRLEFDQSGFAEAFQQRFGDAQLPQAA
ncbi:MAG TPA: hypothetical protein VHU15_06980 [Stellaceae bacterium]|jgi:hypothetical protein|nr:hypothetical protein [Stellaceae bacterium]